MPAANPLSRLNWFLHFTDKSNLEPIRKHGGLYSTAMLQKMGIKFTPGGNDHSLSADRMFGMDKFVHLCVTGGHPMAHLAKQDGRIKEIVWLRIDVAELLKLKGVRFCPGVSNKSGMVHCDIAEAAGKIDDEALFKYLDWNIPENYERRAAVDKYEILVPDHVPIKFFEKNLPK